MRRISAAVKWSSYGDRRVDNCIPRCHYVRFCVKVGRVSIMTGVFRCIAMRRSLRNTGCSVLARRRFFINPPVLNVSRSSWPTKVVACVLDYSPKSPRRWGYADCARDPLQINTRRKMFGNQRLCGGLVTGRLIFYLSHGGRNRGPHFR